MSRSGYSDDYEQWALIRYRGAVASAIRGARGQAFLKEMLQALDSLPEKRLIAGKLENGGEVCALGAVGRKRGINMASLDPEAPECIAAVFGIAEALTREIAWENDEATIYRETPEVRFQRVRKWVADQIR